MRSSLSVFLFFLLLTPLGLSKVWEVPGDNQTIQEAINASSNGDTVLVQPGIYYENINFNGHNIVLASLYLSTGDTSYISSTIIDGGRLGSVVTFSNGEDSTAKIVGFTIQMGLAEKGGGIYCLNASPSIENNVIQNNKCPDYLIGQGAGIYCEVSSAKILNNSIRGNYFENGKGGGIYGTLSRLEIIGNTITDHHLWMYSSNSTIFIHFTDFAIISNNFISNNDVGNNIVCRYAHVNIINNLIIENGGTGISLFYSDSEIKYNTICMNSGPGISCGDSHPKVIGNTIVSNRSVGGYPGGGIVCNPNGHPKLINNILWANQDNQIHGDPDYVKYCNVQGGWSGTGNIDLNPIFVDPLNNNYNVCAQSPCIDAGDPTIIDPDGTRSDIGIFFPNHPETFLGKRWYVSMFGNDSTGNGSSTNPYRTIQRGINSAHHWDTVVVQSGTYLETINIVFKDIVVASNFIFSENQQDIENTIIDGDSNSLVVSFDHSNSPSQIVGFTIMKGIGGINCYYSTITIAHNYIKNNKSPSTGGISLYRSSSQIINNVISENVALSFWEEGIGGGIGCFDSDALIINNTITKNIAESGLIGNGKGGGIYCRASNLIIVNNIFWEDSAEYGPEIYIDSYPTPTITFSNIQDTLWQGEGNISIDPLFRDPENGDYHLMATMCGDPFNSPSIDMGDPNILDKMIDCIWGLADVRSDMGAYGGGDSVLVGIKNQELEIPREYQLSQNFPNPFNPKTTIQYDLPKTSKVILRIYNSLGEEVKALVDEIKNAGNYEVVWYTGNLASGIYFYRLKAVPTGRQTGSFVETKKMVLMK